MKKFTLEDVCQLGSYARLFCDRNDLVPHVPSKKGRDELGYGPQIDSGYSIHFDGRLRKIFVCCYSNAGTCYIKGYGNWRGNNLVIDC